MPTREAGVLQRVLKALQVYGLLLESDPKLPSVVGLVVGEAVRGSWWGHQQGEEIFRINCQLVRQQHILISKLLSGKVTFVHRRLWPAVLAIGCARERWQLKGLSGTASELLKRVDREGEVRTDQLSPAKEKAQAAGTAARDLERRLLVYGEQFHSETGHHAKRLETWDHWASRVGFTPTKVTASQAKADLMETVRILNESFAGKAWLPWQRT